MRVLEELWYGNLYPNEHFIEKNGDYDIALRNFDIEKNKLLSGLSPEQRSIFDEIFNLQITPNAIAERDAFIYGFRLAVRLLTNSLSF